MPTTEWSQAIAYITASHQAFILIATGRLAEMLEAPDAYAECGHSHDLTWYLNGPDRDGIENRAPGFWRVEIELEDDAEDGEKPLWLISETPAKWRQIHAADLVAMGL